MILKMSRLGSSTGLGSSISAPNFSLTGGSVLSRPSPNNRSIAGFRPWRLPMKSIHDRCRDMNGNLDGNKAMLEDHRGVIDWATAVKKDNDERRARLALEFPLTKDSRKVQPRVDPKWLQLHREADGDLLTMMSTWDEQKAKTRVTLMESLAPDAVEGTAKKISTMNYKQLKEHQSMMLEKTTSPANRWSLLHTEANGDARSMVSMHRTKRMMQRSASSPAAKFQ
mmetsp:Transcript_1804/g.3104  ORF Transcript_1804/g.3104 Transcript_1804/m.3104 type:complete len:225 (-) Transcript_1804:4-678(-)